MFVIIHVPAPPPPEAHVRQPGAGVITQPDWSAVPTADELMALYPKDAVEKHVEGRVTIKCAVSAQGRLTDCSVVAEDPADAGFGASALKLAALFQMRPMTKDGQPVGGGSVRIPIRFVLPTKTVSADEAAKFIAHPLWVRAVSEDALQRTYPSSTMANGLAGEVVLTCTAAGSGKLEQCSARSEGLGADQFQASALRMASLLQMRPQDADGRPVEGRRVNIALFYMPSFAVSTLRAVQVTYPGPHAFARVNCRILAGGKLDNCFTRGASPPTEQVADAAAKLAATIVVDKGLPSQRRVIIPLELMPLEASR